MRIILTKKDFQKPISINGERVELGHFARYLAELGNGFDLCEMVITSDEIKVTTSDKKQKK